MGKIIRRNINILLNRLGPYAFPNGKPSLDWGGGSVTTHSVIATLVHLIPTDDIPGQVNNNAELRITLNVPSNLYVVDDETLSVRIDGEPMSTAEGGGNSITYGEGYASVTIVIGHVTGEVTINASAITYESRGLVLLLDGKNQGDISARWKNLCDESKPLVLSGGYTKNTDNVAFNGSSGRGVIQSFGMNLPYDLATLEAVLSFDTLPSDNTYLVGSGNDHNTLLYIGGEANNTTRKCLFPGTVGEHGQSLANTISARVDSAANVFLFQTNEVISLSRQGMSYKKNNNTLNTTDTQQAVIVGDSQSTFNAAGYIFVSGCTTRAGVYYAPFSGKMYCIRAYTSTLTPEEVAKNYKVDQKRFNLNS